jgi:hypothetical protein
VAKEAAARSGTHLGKPWLYQGAKACWLRPGLQIG